jgi:hypothetical protein
MKINYKPTLLTIMMLVFNFAAFAQEIPDPNEGEPGGEDPPASINMLIVYLAVLAVAFAYYQFNMKKKIAQ